MWDKVIVRGEVRCASCGLVHARPGLLGRWRLCLKAQSQSIALIMQVVQEMPGGPSAIRRVEERQRALARRRVEADSKVNATTEK